MNYKLFSVESNLILCYYSRPIEGVNSNLRSPMLNSLREWGERRSTRVFALKIAQKHLEFEGVCTVTILCINLLFIQIFTQKYRLRNIQFYV